MADSAEYLELNKAVSVRIHRLRENLGLSKNDLIEQVDISTSFMNEIEQGRRGVSLVNLRKLSTALHTTTDYLLFGREEFSDVTNVAFMLSTMDETFVKGAEELLKTYMNSVSYSEALLRKKLAEKCGE